MLFFIDKHKQFSKKQSVLFIQIRKTYLLSQTRVRGITCSAYVRHGKVMGSRLGRGTMAVDGAIGRP